MSVLNQEPIGSVTIGTTYNIHVTRNDWSYPWTTMLHAVENLETLDRAVITKIIQDTYFNTNPDIVVRELIPAGWLVYGCDIWQKCTNNIGVDIKLGELRIMKKRS